MTGFTEKNTADATHMRAFSSIEIEFYNIDKSEFLDHQSMKWDTNSDLGVRNYSGDKYHKLSRPIGERRIDHIKIDGYLHMAQGDDVRVANLNGVTSKEFDKAFAGGDGMGMIGRTVVIKESAFDNQEKDGSKYLVTVLAKDGDNSVVTDVYRILDACGVTNPQLGHLIKKALHHGKRGHKDARQDLLDIIESAQDALTMHDQKAAQDDK